MNQPHGGVLINRFANKDKLSFDNIALSIELDDDQLSEVKNIAVGTYSPLNGYMNKDDFESVLEKARLTNGVPWSVPVFLPVSKVDYRCIKVGGQVSLRYKGKDIALMEVSDKFTFDAEKYVKSVYGTTDPNHPGVAMINSLSTYVIGGEIWVYEELPSKYLEFDLPPQKTRELFAEKGWNTVVGFQTRNAAHRAHEFIQKMCLEFVDGLFINPIIGKKKSGDFTDEVILAVYKMLVRDFYPANSTAIGVYSSRMHYAGPKEAIFHAIVRKNFGCTHFIVGRDHAGVGDYYDKFAAHRIFDEFEDIGIVPMRVSNAFFDKKSDMYTTQKASPFGPEHWISPSGTEVRRLIKEKNYKDLKYILRPEVLEEILKFKEPFVL
ncbi:MAG: sulfate adenylyltransferase [Candidatus Dojkabacteria bacterium]|uniref:sulfate adenylyltransferase n=1 Tax=candidate division WS6 bacterium OLB21 TaxID=1617427 RepID=A0A136KGD0_9BACT|nr:MAG: Sulfate adenylyltransferase [candidate division WS6 bacterium OLB21]WKZ27636.1 MAG: sulfate adenylyltransferase [Candidatus Dojkabacteria bacterium]